MLNFLGRDSPPTIPNSSKLAARFQPDTRKCTEVQSTLSIRECNPSFNRVYVTSREDPSSPPLRGLPRSGRKNDCSSEVSSFLSLSNSAAGQPRDTVESLERKGKERKERKKERKWEEEEESVEEDAKGKGTRGDMYIQTRLVYQRFGFLPTFFPTRLYFLRP